MKNTLDFETWKSITKSEFVNVVEKLNFKGYTSVLSVCEDDGTVLPVKTRSVSNITDILAFDFSNCYLYNIEKVAVLNTINEDTTSPWDYDFTELGNFENNNQYAYRIRYAGIERYKS